MPPNPLTFRLPVLMFGMALACLIYSSIGLGKTVTLAIRSQS